MAPRIDTRENVKSTLKDLVDKYSIMARYAENGAMMRQFTAGMDKLLLRSVVTMHDHPEDTGLMKKSWRVPTEYLESNSGKRWEIFIENTATVGQQYQLKYGTALYSAGNYTKRGRKGISFRSIRRYMPYVDKKTQFYSKKVRLIRQRIPAVFKKYIDEMILYKVYMAGDFLPIERAQYEIEFNR